MFVVFIVAYSVGYWCMSTGLVLFPIPIMASSTSVTTITTTRVTRASGIALIAAGALASAAIGAGVALAVTRRRRVKYVTIFSLVFLYMFFVWRGHLLNENRKVLAPGVAGLPLFSSAVVHGDTIYVSGTLGTLPGSRDLAKGEKKVMNAKEQALADITAETTQTLVNIKAILEHVHGITAEYVAKNPSKSPFNKITKVNVSLKVTSLTSSL
jgi:enamine deaminase RidA (YjgF/YER057c/UK114 family)